MPRGDTVNSPTFDVLAKFFVKLAHLRSLRLYRATAAPKDNGVGGLFNFSGVATKNAAGSLGTSCQCHSPHHDANGGFQRAFKVSFDDIRTALAAAFTHGVCDDSHVDVTNEISTAVMEQGPTSKTANTCFEALLLHIATQFMFHPLMQPLFRPCGDNQAEPVVKVAKIKNFGFSADIQGSSFIDPLGKICEGKKFAMPLTVNTQHWLNVSLECSKMGNCPSIIEIMATGQLVVNVIFEIGYPGKTGGGRYLRAHHCFFDASLQTETYKQVEDSLTAAAAKKKADAQKENIDAQCATATKRAKKARDKADRAEAAVNVFAAAVGNIRGFEAAAANEDDGVIAAAADTESD